MKKLLLLFIPLLFIACEKNAEVEQIEEQEETTEQTVETTAGEPVVIVRVPAERYDFNLTGKTNEKQGWKQRWYDYDTVIADDIHFFIYNGELNYDGLQVKDFGTITDFSNGTYSNFFKISNYPTDTHKIRFSADYSTTLFAQIVLYVFSSGTKIGEIELVGDINQHIFSYEFEAGTTDFEFIPLNKESYQDYFKLYNITIERID